MGPFNHQPSIFFSCKAEPHSLVILHQTNTTIQGGEKRHVAAPMGSKTSWDNIVCIAQHSPSHFLGKPKHLALALLPINCS